MPQDQGEPDVGSAGAGAGDTEGLDARAGNGGTRNAGEPEDALKAVERELAVLLRRARAFSGQFAREFHPDLDAGAYALMIWLDDVGSARLTDMATFFGVGKPTVSRQIQLLERLDLVTRTADDTDRRAQTLSLTPDGAHRLHLVRDARRARFRTLLAPWPEPDVAALGDLLGRLNQAMSSPLLGPGDPGDPHDQHDAAALDVAGR